MRIKELFEIPCAVRGLSIEPMLGPVDISAYLNVFVPDPAPGEWVYPIHWVIVGGETGNDNGQYLYRPCKTEWIRDVVAQCKDKDVPVFVKQLGTHLYRQLELADRAGDNFDDPKFPIVLKHREYPVTV